MKTLNFKYCFNLSSKRQETFSLELDEKNLTLKNSVAKKLPSWTKLEQNQCSICPIRKDSLSHCPLASKLTIFVDKFDTLTSFDEVYVEFFSRQRNVSKVTDAQHAISSMMGLLIAVSGCPYTEFFRPMARFHLPFPNLDETVYRATATYLMAQYYLNREGKSVDIELNLLKDIYCKVNKVNKSIIERLKTILSTDSSINAMLVLDAYALWMPEEIDSSLNKFRELFTPYFTTEL